MKFIIILLSFLLCLPILGQDLIGESVEYDPVGDRYFVSSDGNSIQVYKHGIEPEVSYFGDGLEADFGMEVMNNHLFALSGSTVYVYDLDTEMEVTAIDIPGGQFLNGMASDGDNRIWVTDFSAGSIYEITYDADPSQIVVEEIVSDLDVTPNGIVYDAPNDRLIFVTWSGGKVMTVDADKNVSELADVGLQQMDGIDDFIDGQFFVSSWGPNRITLFNSDFSAADTVTEDVNNAADICYGHGTGAVAIPSTSNELIIYQYAFFETGINKGNLSAINFWPNPAGNEIQLDLASVKEEVQVNLFDVSGKFVAKLYEGAPQAIGTLDLSDIARGQYLLRIETAEQSYSAPLLKQ